jgi:hypothetical protein
VIEGTEVAAIVGEKLEDCGICEGTMARDVKGQFFRTNLTERRRFHCAEVGGSGEFYVPVSLGGRV